MSDFDSAISPKRRRKVVAEEPVTQEVTVAPEPVQVVIVEPAAPEPKLSARTLAEIEHGRETLKQYQK